MGWDLGEGFKKEGTHVYLWLIHADVWQKPAQYCKAIILQLKINTFLKMSIPLKKKERFPYACTTYNKIKSNSLILSNIQCIETSPSCPRRTGFIALWTSVLDGA